MTDTNQMREQFEAWAKKNYVSVCGSNVIERAIIGDGYRLGNVNAAWHGWQASRQAVIVELPTFDGYKDFIVRELQAAFSAAIEAQGLRVGVRTKQKAEYQFEPVPGAECSMILYAQGKPYPKTCQVHGLRCGVKS